MKPRTEIRIHNNGPAIFVDGRQQVPLAFWRGPDHDYKFLEDFAKAGVRIVFFTVDLKYWKGPGEYDFSGLDEIFSKTVKACPQVLMIPWMFLMPPRWWVDSNPSELRMREDLSAYQGSPDEYLRGQLLPSIASEKWRKDTLDFLDAYISHCEQGPFAEHIIGYHLSSEQSEEWFYWGGPEIDYNPANEASFRQWLGKKYGTDEALQDSWRNHAVFLNSAKIPSVKSRRSPAAGEFFSPETQKDVIDFYGYHHWKIVDTIRCFAALVKEKTGRRALVSVFYGYQLQSIPRGQLDSGHYALGELLRSKDIDMLSSPTCYTGRELGTGYSYFMSLAGSVKLHGKLWFDENDIRTHINVPGNDGYGKTKTLEETISMQWREFGNAVCNSVASWWMDQSGGWYNDPCLLEEIGRIFAAGRQALECDMSGSAEIAVVIDERSQHLRGPQAKFQSWHNIVDIGHIGAPVDFILLEDIPLARPYKVYFFKFCYRLNAGIMKMLERIVKTDDRWAVWLEQSCFFDEDARTVTHENAEAATGFSLTRALQAVNEDADLSSRVGKPAKKLDKWTSVYLKDQPSADDLRTICREAGVHLYLETGDVVYANRSFLCVHANGGGEKKIKLPVKADVFDLISQKEIGKALQEFTVTMKPLSTVVFLLK